MTSGWLVASDGKPGPLTLWRGWKRLQDVVEGARLYQGYALEAYLGYDKPFIGGFVARPISTK